MSVNKNALIRYKTLDKCLSNFGRKYFIEDLLEECNNQLFEIDSDSNGIQKRQLFDDIRFMESSEGWSAIIDKIPFGKKKFYRYDDPNFSIDNQPLNSLQLENLKSALNIISRFKGMPQFEWVNEFAPKLEQTYLKNNTIPIISFDNNEYLKGIEYLSDLFHAVLNKKVLRIIYQSFKSTIPKTFTIHPYYLKQYNNRWFLFGKNESLQKLTNLALDRIIFIEEENLPYSENKEYNFEEYFEDIVGVTRPDNAIAEKILLSFKNSLLPYIISKPLHGSQKIIKAKNEQLISLEVIINYELESLLLSFGELVKILSPLHLQQQIINRLGIAKTNYNSS